MQVDDRLVALPARAAARLAAVSARRLRGWEDRGLVEPSVRRQLSERNTVRLYGFQDLLGVLIVRELSDHGAHPRTIGRLVDHLRGHYERPLTQVRWAVGSKPVFAGTRVPVEAVESYLRRDVDDERILEALPQLAPADVAAARDAMSVA